MLARNIAIWAVLMLILLTWTENYYFVELRKMQLVLELGANIEAQADADLDAIGNPGKVVLLTDSTFHRLVSSGKHFVKFYSPWCPYCRHMAPTWGDLAKELEHEPAVTISKIDCTKYHGPCQAFDVGEYPMLLWIEDGKKIEMYEGNRSIPQMLDFVKKFLGHDEPSETQALNTTTNFKFI